MYYKDLEWCLKLSYFIGCHPKNKRSYLQTLQFILILCGCVTIPTLTILMFYYKKEPLTIKNITSVSGNFTFLMHGTIKLTTLFMRKSQILDLFDYTKQKFWKMDESKEIKQILARSKLLTRDIFFNSVLLFVLAAVIKPHLIGGGFLTYKCFKPEWLPRPCLLLIEDLMCITINMIFSCFDISISTLLTLTMIQFKMLNKKMKNLYEFEDGEEYDESVLDERMKECVDHYNTLMEFVNRFSRTFSKPLFLFIGAITLSMCLCMYKMTTGNPSIKILIEAFFHLLAGLNEICICYSRPAQALMEEANSIGTSIYFSKWYEHPQHAKNLITIMSRGQKELEITAAGIIKIDMEMFIGAVKTMVSYCMFLRTVSIMD